MYWLAKITLFRKDYYTLCPTTSRIHDNAKTLFEWAESITNFNGKKKWTQKDTTRTPVCAGDGMCLGYTSIQMTIFEKG